MTGREFLRAALWLLMLLGTVTAVAVMFIPVAPEDLPLARQAATSCALAASGACLTLNLLRWLDAADARARERRRQGIIAFHQRYQQAAADGDRLEPANAHPLNARDCERSAARLADIELGLRADVAGWDYWHDKAESRVAVLEVEARDFGLMPHEEAELEQLKAMLTSTNERLAVND